MSLLDVISCAECMRRAVSTSHDNFLLPYERHELDRFGPLEWTYSLPIDKTRKRGERATARGQAVKMTILKMEIARELARDGGANRARFFRNNIKQRHMQVLPVIFAV
jgi:hypothetical protein